MKTGAGRYEQVRVWNSNACFTRQTCESGSQFPHFLKNGKVWQRRSQFNQGLFLSGTTGTVPKFQADHRAPAGFSIRQSCFHARTNRLIAVMPQHVNPR